MVPTTDSTSAHADDNPAALQDAPQLDAKQFARVQSLAHERFGLSLPASKRTMVGNRLSMHERAHGFADIEALLRHYEAAPDGEAMLPLFDSLSTNLTSFFREPQHFDCLQREILQPLVGLGPGGRTRLRFWSAGCSSGCEPYTLSMVLHDVLGDLSGWDVRILATDLSVTQVAAAREACYRPEMVESLAPDLIERHFRYVVREGEARVMLRPHVLQPLTFALLNLMEPWKIRGPFDAIFCRNVMIYFDEATRAGLVTRLAKLLRPGGILFVGSSEALPRNRNDLDWVAPSSYRKRE